MNQRLLYASPQEGVLNAMLSLSEGGNLIFTTHSPYLYKANMLKHFYLAVSEHEKNDRDFEEHNIKLVKNPDLKDKKLEEYLRTILDSNKLNLPNIKLNNNNLFLEGFED